MFYRASSIGSRLPADNRMSCGASAPVEVGTRGTIGSLLKKEIEYFKKVEMEFSCGGSPLKPQSSSWPDVPLKSSLGVAKYSRALTTSPIRGRILASSWMHIAARARACTISHQVHEISVVNKAESEDLSQEFPVSLNTIPVQLLYCNNLYPNRSNVVNKTARNLNVSPEN
nr:uncharacterized protein LOC109167064 [Ipomoea batatas]